MLRFARLLRVCIIIVPALAAAQKPLVLSKPDAEHTDPFSQITGVRELAGGRVLVSDGRDRIVQIIDFKGSATKVGREGAGPGEYAMASAIAALPGDSSAIWDGGNRRYLMVLPDGKTGKEFRLEPPEGVGARGYGAFAATIPRGVDARGNIYFPGSPFTRNVDGGPAPSDSLPIIRFDRAAQRADTVAFARVAKGSNTVTASPTGRGVSITNGLGNPLVPRDEWAVLPDGRVAVVRFDSYRVDFYSARNTKTSGPVVAYDPIRVDAAVRTMVTEDRKRQLRDAAPRARPGSDPSDVPPNVIRNLLNLDPWPQFMPPFVARAVLARPGGPGGATSQVWVMRAQEPAAAPLYDVFDGTGRRIAQVQTPANTRVIAFGRGTVYLIRTDDDGLEYLQRYRLTAIGAVAQPPSWKNFRFD